MSTVALLPLFHRRLAVAVADGRVILLLSQIFIKAAFTDIDVPTRGDTHPPRDCVWHRAFQSLIKGRTSITSRTTRVAGCSLTAVKLPSTVLANDFSKPCCTKKTGSTCTSVPKSPLQNRQLYEKLCPCIHIYKTVFK